jgi:hypothetical protein
VRTKSWTQALIVPLLVVAAVALGVAVLAAYADRVLFSSSGFADRVALALQDRAVQERAGSEVADAMLRADPDLIAVEPVLRAAATGVAGSEAFGAVARGAAYQAHASLFSDDGDTLALTAANATLLVVDALEAQGVPVRARAERARADLARVGGLAADVARVADRVRALEIVAGLVGLAGFAAAILLTAQRRLAIRRAGLAVAAVGGVLLTALLAGETALLAAADPAAREARRGVLDAFLGDLRTWSVVLVAAGLVVAAAADAVLRPIGIVGRLRQAALALATRPASPPRRVARALGLAAAGAVTLAAPDAVLRLVVLAVGAVLLALGLEELLRLNARDAEDDARREGTVPRVPLRRAVVGAAAAMAVVVALVGAAVATDSSDDVPAVAAGTCNGQPTLCDRRLADVTFPATHNAMSAPRAGFLIPNQDVGLRGQLEMGIRGLLLDTHLGVRTPRGVYTLLEPGGKSRQKAVAAIGENGVARAERLRRSLGYAGGGDPEPFLCHGYCELGATPLVDALREIRDFLVARPGEVLVLSLEDQISPQQTAEAFRESGLLDLVWTGDVWPLPTLGEMVRRDGRVLVLAEDDAAGVPWYHQQFELVQDTPYDVPTARRLLSDASCVRRRGAASNPMLMLNMWVAEVPPRPSQARIVNRPEALVQHARACSRVLGAPPTLLAVDFVGQGDVVEAARRLNRR